jgi:hypothetical protein
MFIIPFENKGYSKDYINVDSFKPKKITTGLKNFFHTSILSFNTSNNIIFVVLSRNKSPTSRKPNRGNIISKWNESKFYKSKYVVRNFFDASISLNFNTFRPDLFLKDYEEIRLEIKEKFGYKKFSNSDLQEISRMIESIFIKEFYIKKDFYNTALYHFLFREYPSLSIYQNDFLNYNLPDKIKKLTRYIRINTINYRCEILYFDFLCELLNNNYFPYLTDKNIMKIISEYMT